MFFLGFTAAPNDTPESRSTQVWEMLVQNLGLAGMDGERRQQDTVGSPPE